MCCTDVQGGAQGRKAAFEQHMLRLKRDLDLLNLPTDTLDTFAGRT